MELKEQKDGWHLSFKAGVVQLIQIDFRLGLILSDSTNKATLVIETPCHLKNSNKDFLLVPEKTASVAPILSLFNAKVDDIMIKKTGHLKMQFGDHHCLEISPDASYEAWQLSCSIGFTLVCSPGGKVSLFKEARH